MLRVSWLELLVKFDWLKVGWFKGWELVFKSMVVKPPI